MGSGGGQDSLEFQVQVLSPSTCAMVWSKSLCFNGPPSLRSPRPLLRIPGALHTCSDVRVLGGSAQMFPQKRSNRPLWGFSHALQSCCQHSQPLISDFLWARLSVRNTIKPEGGGWGDLLSVIRTEMWVGNPSVPTSLLPSNLSLEPLFSKLVLRS